jgi:plasmid stability protein
MANITIRDLPDNTKESLRVQAAKSGVSLEAYARYILQTASASDVFMQPGILDLADKYFGAKKGVNLELPKRSSEREEVKFKT